MRKKVWIVVLLLSFLMSACQKSDLSENESKTSQSDSKTKLESTVAETTEAEITEAEVSTSEESVIEETISQERTSQETTSQETASQEITSQETSTEGSLSGEMTMTDAEREALVNEIKMNLELDEGIVEESIQWSFDESFVIFVREYENEDDYEEPHRVFAQILGQDVVELEGCVGISNEIQLSPDESSLFVSMGMNVFRQGFVFDTDNFENSQELGWITGPVMWSKDSHYLGFSGTRDEEYDLSHVIVDLKVYNSEIRAVKDLILGDETMGINFLNWNEIGIEYSLSLDNGSPTYIFRFENIEKNRRIDGSTNTVVYEDKHPDLELMKDMVEVNNLSINYEWRDESFVREAWLPEIEFQDKYNGQRFDKGLNEIIDSFDHLGDDSLLQGFNYQVIDYEMEVVNQEFISILLKGDYYYEESLVYTIYDSLTISAKDGYIPELYSLFTAEEHEHVVGDMIEDAMINRQIDQNTDFVAISDDTKYYLTNRGIVFYYPMSKYTENGKLLEVELSYEALYGIIDLEYLPRI